jgi:TatD DNase family protein
MLLDIHTHRVSDDANVIGILNVACDDGEPAFPCLRHSIGLHPWQLDDVDVARAISMLERYAGDPRVVAIGECGIDRAIATPVDRQVEVFLQQLRIAEQVRKPLIIHNVRAASDLLALHGKCDATLPWIVHGFTGNAETARQLITHGMYLSFGAALLDTRRALRGVFRALPLEQVFLETDDADVHILSILEAAAALREMDSALLAAAVLRNGARVFPWLNAEAARRQA